MPSSVQTYAVLQRRQSLPLSDGRLKVPRTYRLAGFLFFVTRCDSRAGVHSIIPPLLEGVNFTVSSLLLGNCGSKFKRPSEAVAVTLAHLRGETFLLEEFIAALNVVLGQTIHEL